MKKYILGLTAAIAIVTPSCESLEVAPTGFLASEVAYSSVDHLDMVVKNFYSTFHAVADIETGKGLTAIDDGVSDLLKSTWYNVDGGAFNKFFFLDNYLTVESNFRSNWGTMYTYIRIINQFFDDYNEGTIALPAEEVAPRLAEARFIRAFAYHQLVTRHGGVILRDEVGGTDDHRQNNKSRMSTADSWEYVISEYKKAAADLPDAWPAADNGRITKGAAYGMIARAALYAERWNEAIEAANEVIGSSQYALLPGTTVTDYNKIFELPANKELILPVYYEVGNKQHSWNTWIAPNTDAVLATGAEAGAAISPTEEYVSQFDIKVNGTWESFDWDNLAKYGNDPYANRDPRFYASILYNGCTWKGRKLEFYEGGSDGFMPYTGLGSRDNVHYTCTGYLIRKFLTTKEYTYTYTLSDQLWPEMRLAEVYLIRSEAYARTNKWSEAYTDLNTIRGRVGLSAKAQKSNWTDYLVDLQKERICELGMEGHRYDDIMRWNIHQQVLNGQRVHGVKITKVGDNLNYEVVECDLQDRKFPVKYSIFPIPYSEIQANPLCEQNELWK
ncbi:MAG: RagB/SusD family nutrient uptake outer membrane protein [Bacteroides sp.]|nr:RagB/SusD family nutrient uptake outer membrane protein [Bacteroides sp.]